MARAREERRAVGGVVVALMGLIGLGARCGTDPQTQALCDRAEQCLRTLFAEEGSSSAFDAKVELGDKDNRKICERAIAGAVMIEQKRGRPLPEACK